MEGPLADPAAQPTTGQKSLESVSHQGHVRTLLTNPWFGGIAGSASIVSLTLAIYLFIAGQPRPRLTMYVNPIRTAVVKAGQTSALTVLYNGVETGPNVTAAQIAIWNAGKAPIRMENILDDLTLRLDPDYRILEATVRKVPVVALRLLPADPDSRRLRLQWRILEPGDGAVIQIVYDGPASIGRFILRGTIEGQPDLVTVSPDAPDQGAAVDASPRVNGLKMLGMIVLGALFLPFTGNLLRRLFKRLPWLAYAIALGMLCGILGFAGTAVYLVYDSFTKPYPPFGF